MNKPMVTAVQGFAAGAGFSLAMMGDIVLAGNAAHFTLAYTGVGLSPDGGAIRLLPRLVGLRRAQQLLLDNPRLSATQALGLGLVTEVIADDDLQQMALERAIRLAAGPRAPLPERALLLSAYGHPLETHLELEARFIVGNAAAQNSQKSIAAFTGKRRPDFSTTG